MTDALFDVETSAAVGAPVPAVAGNTASEPLLVVHVVGVPQPQGSKRGFVVGKRAVVVDDNKAPLRTWRQDVIVAASDALLTWQELHRRPWDLDSDDRGFDVDVTFLLPRPLGHFGTGRNAGYLKGSAPRRPTTKPDVDKLLRSTLDALKLAQVVRDDSRVVTLTGRKHYATEHPGALIQIYAGSTT